MVRQCGFKGGIVCPVPSNVTEIALASWKLIDLYRLHVATNALFHIGRVLPANFALLLRYDGPQRSSAAVPSPIAGTAPIASSSRLSSCCLQSVGIATLGAIQLNTHRACLRLNGAETIEDRSVTP